MFESVKSVMVPFLIVATCFVVSEMIVSFRLKQGLYSLKDALCNLVIFVGGRLSQPLFLTYIYWALQSIEKFQIFNIPDTAWSTAIVFVLTDFLYYWEHRASHSLAPLWLFHEVHHSSKYFNLTTSFRLSWLGRLTAPIFFGPLVFLGFKPEQLVLFFTANLFFQFFLHTKMVPKLGILEGVFNTPSAHRVHHARNPIYLDKNFGGILMLWDRMFGTYQSESESPQFGVTGNFESDNPLTVQFHKMPGYIWLVKRLTRNGNLLLR
jgi:sterol desaturase/sphingolipid hydroxylase (fatty acid hydroxylase superfamily)